MEFDNNRKQRASDTAPRQSKQLAGEQELKQQGELLKDFLETCYFHVPKGLLELRIAAKEEAQELRNKQAHMAIEIDAAISQSIDKIEKEFDTPVSREVRELIILNAVTALTESHTKNAGTPKQTLFKSELQNWVSRDFRSSQDYQRLHEQIFNAVYAVQDAAGLDNLGIDSIRADKIIADGILAKLSGSKRNFCEDAIVAVCPILGRFQRE